MMKSEVKMSNLHPSYDSESIKVESITGPSLILLYGDPGSGKTTCFVEWANRLLRHGRKVSFSSMGSPLGLMKGVMPYFSPTWSDSDVVFVDRGNGVFRRNILIQELMRSMGSKDRILFVSDYKFSKMEMLLASNIFMIRDHRLHIERNRGLVLGSPGNGSGEPKDDHDGMVYNQYNDRWTYL
jgi:DNA replication protein DnaC